MSDRLQEIRARLDAATPGPWTPVFINGVESPGTRNPVPPWAQNDLIAHAPADIAWLLEELHRVWDYVYHRNSCAVVQSPANKCDCGLADLESGNP